MSRGNLLLFVLGCMGVFLLAVILYGQVIENDRRRADLSDRAEQGQTLLAKAAAGDSKDIADLEQNAVQTRVVCDQLLAWLLGPMTRAVHAVRPVLDDELLDVVELVGAPTSWTGTTLVNCVNLAAVERSKPTDGTKPVTFGMDNVVRVAKRSASQAVAFHQKGTLVLLAGALGAVVYMLHGVLNGSMRILAESLFATAMLRVFTGAICAFIVSLAFFHFELMAPPTAAPIAVAFFAGLSVDVVLAMFHRFASVIFGGEGR